MSLFDMDKEFEKGVQEFEPKDSVIKIAAKTVTPLLQLDDTGSQRKRYVYEENQSGQVPFFSANGLRGALRRVAFAQQIRTAKEKNPDFTVSPEIFYLYTSGGGFDKTSALLDEYFTPFTEEIIRKNAPILSLFGAGLSHLEGKLAVADLTPQPDFTKVEKDGNAYLVSKLIGTNTFFRTDSAESAKSLFRTIIDMKDIEEWKKEYLEKVNIAKNKKKAEGGKEESSHIQQPVTLEFVIPGVQMFSSMDAKYGYELSEIELGCLISSIAELSLMQIGSAKRIGFGILDWTVEINGELILQTASDPHYVLKREQKISEAGKEYIEIWQNWARESGHRVEIEKLTQ